MQFDIATNGLIFEISILSYSHGRRGTYEYPPEPSELEFEITGIKLDGGDPIALDDLESAAKELDELVYIEAVERYQEDRELSRAGI